MVGNILRELKQLQSALADGGDVTEEAVDSLMSRVRCVADDLSEAEIRKVDGAIRRLEEVARDRFEEMGEELRRLNYGRQALRGYNHLRGVDSCQRLYRRA